MSKHLLISSTLALVLAALMAGCGSDESAKAQAPGEPGNAVLTSEFSRCPFTNDVQPSAGGWAGSVAGDLSCAEAGRLIQDRFNYDFGQSGLQGSDADSIRESDPGRFTSAGYDCASFPLPDGMGWHMLCGKPDAQVSFYFTP